MAREDSGLPLRKVPGASSDSLPAGERTVASIDSGLYALDF